MLRIPMLAGWLFADLFLVLFIVAFSSQPTVLTPKLTHSPTPKPSVTLTPAVTHSASPAPTPPVKPTPLGLEQKPQDIKVYVSPADVDNPVTKAAAIKKLLAGLNKQLADKHLLGRRAGFVVVFATSVAGAPDPVDEALKVANSILPVLRKENAAMFGRTGGEGLWGGASGDLFHFQIFFFTQ